MPGHSHITSEKTGWIESRGARVGNEVELLPEREHWTVAEVYDLTLPEDALKEHRQLNRNSLPSVEGMGP
jgi:hypothetical protein